MSVYVEGGSPRAGSGGRPGTGAGAWAGRRGALGWFAASIALFYAVLVVPAAVAEWSSANGMAMDRLSGAVSAGFADWVTSGAPIPSEQLSSAASFWAVFHLVKAALAAALIVALIPVGRRLWGAYARSESRYRRVPLWVAGVIGAPVLPVLLFVVMANVQGAVAPVSSVLTFLGADSAPATEQIRAQLAAGTTTPVLAALIDDFRLYHAVLVVALVVAVVVVIAVTALLWMRRARSPREQRRLRRVLAAGGLIVPMLLPVLGVLLLANLSTVEDTAPALAVFFDGSGW